jgi:hypothetical protein
VPKVTSPVPDTKRKAFELLIEACAALRRENKEVLWASMIKETMKRKKPSFNETYHGFNTFSALLEGAQAEGLVSLERDEKRGTYSVTRFGEELETGPRKEQPRSRTREAAPPAFTKQPTRGLPPKPIKPARGEKLAERPAIMTPRPLEDDDIKPREQRFQGFSDFTTETNEFLGPRKQVNFEDEFAHFANVPHRSSIGSTAEEVMANINESRSEPRKPIDRPVSPVPAEPTFEKSEDDGDRGKKKRRRGGKGKERVTEEAAAAAPVADVGPITFDDVPFIEAHPEQHPDANLFPVEDNPFGFGPPEPVIEKPSKSAARQVFEEIQPPEPPPVKKHQPVEPPQEKAAEQPRGFGFGIFDE